MQIHDRHKAEFCRELVVLIYKYSNPTKDTEMMTQAYWRELCQTPWEHVKWALQNAGRHHPKYFPNAPELLLLAERRQAEVTAQHKAASRPTPVGYLPSAPADAVQTDVGREVMGQVLALQQRVKGKSPAAQSQAAMAVVRVLTQTKVMCG